MDRARFGSVRSPPEIPARRGRGAGIGRASERGGAILPGLSDLRAAGQADGRRVDAEGFGELAQLRDDVGPFAKAQIVEELGAAHSTKRGAGELAALGVEVTPQGEVREEVGGARREAGVQLIGLRALFGGALAHVLDGQGGDQHEHFRGAAVLVRFQEHAPQPRVDGEPGQPPADGCEAGPAVYRPDLGQELGARAHSPLLGRVDERKVRDVPQSKRKHLEDDRREGGSLDLRLRELLAPVEVLLRI